MTTELGKLTIDNFLPLLNTEFEVSVHGNPTTLILSECRPGAPGADWHGRKPFDLIFTVKEKIGLNQGTHPLICAALGKIEVFLVPIGPSSFQAVFN